MSMELLEAARSGNVYKMQSLLGAGAEINFHDNNRDTALHIATLNGSQDAIDFLIRYNAAVNAIDRYYETPLHKAVNRGSADIVETLIKAGANLESRNYLGYTPLHSAVLSGRNSELVYALIDLGCDIYTSNDLGESLLHTAVREGAAELAEYLLAKGLSPDLQDNDGNRPLHVVAARKNTMKRDTTQIAAILLKHGANINATNCRQQTALHCAAFGGELRTVALLCEHGGSIHAQDNRGWLPIHIALGANASDIEEYLLSQESIEDAPIVETGQDKPEPAVDILLRATLAESQEQLPLMREVLNHLYHYPDFRVLIDLAAIHAMKTRRQHKALRILLADGKDVSSISPKGGSNTYFPDTHVITVSTAHSKEKLAGLVAYELARHGAQFIFRNGLLPYPASDSVLEKIYKTAIDLDTRASYLALGIEEKEIQRLVISRTFIYSKTPQKLPEYNAGLAQAIAIFGNGAVEKVCPALYYYFAKHFLPLCTEALEENVQTRFLMEMPQEEAPATYTFPVQKISSSAINATVITELVSLGVLAKLGMPKSDNVPPSALQTGYMLDRTVKNTLSRSLAQLEKLLERNLDIVVLPETVYADDLRKLIKAFVECYTNGISRDILLPPRKQLKQVILHWQEGFIRMNPRSATPGLLEKLAVRYLPQQLYARKTASAGSLRLSGNVSLSNLLEDVNHTTALQTGGEGIPTATRPEKQEELV